MAIHAYGKTRPWVIHAHGNTRPWQYTPMAIRTHGSTRPWQHTPMAIHARDPYQIRNTCSLYRLGRLRTPQEGAGVGIQEGPRERGGGRATEEISRRKIGFNCDARLPGDVIACGCFPPPLLLLSMHPPLRGHPPAPRSLSLFFTLALSLDLRFIVNVLRSQKCLPVLLFYMSVCLLLKRLLHSSEMFLCALGYLIFRHPCVLVPVYSA